MKKLVQFVHDNQIVVAALILFLAVLVYCVFNRYCWAKCRDLGLVLDRLTGNCHRVDGAPFQKPYSKPVKPN